LHCPRIHLITTGFVPEFLSLNEFVSDHLLFAGKFKTGGQRGVALEKHRNKYCLELLEIKILHT
jgi:hypothetical protein